MKVLLSSKYLANELAKIDFDDCEKVVYVIGDKDNLIIKTNRKTIRLDAETVVTSEIYQTDRRWDWVKLLVTKVDEQPIVLVIHESFVSVVFQY